MTFFFDVNYLPLKKLFWKTTKAFGTTLNHSLNDRLGKCWEKLWHLQYFIIGPFRDRKVV